MQKKEEERKMRQSQMKRERSSRMGKEKRDSGRNKVTDTEMHSCRKKGFLGLSHPNNDRSEVKLCKPILVTSDMSFLRNGLSMKTGSHPERARLGRVLWVWTLPSFMASWLQKLCNRDLRENNPVYSKGCHLTAGQQKQGLGVSHLL